MTSNVLSGAGPTTAASDSTHPQVLNMSSLGSAPGTPVVAVVTPMYAVQPAPGQRHMIPTITGMPLDQRQQEMQPQDLQHQDLEEPKD